MAGISRFFFFLDFVLVFLGRIFGGAEDWGGGIEDKIASKAYIASYIAPPMTGNSCSPCSYLLPHFSGPPQPTSAHVLRHCHRDRKVCASSPTTT